MYRLLILIFNLFKIWRFILSKKFRKDYIVKFRKMSLTRKFIKIFFIIITLIINISALSLIFHLFTAKEDIIKINNTVDVCHYKDSSYNYDICQCDYNNQLYDDECF